MREDHFDSLVMSGDVSLENLIQGFFDLTSFERSERGKNEGTRSPGVFDPPLSNGFLFKGE